MTDLYYVVVNQWEFNNFIAMKTFILHYRYSLHWEVNIFLDNNLYKKFFNWTALIRLLEIINLIVKLSLYITDNQRIPTDLKNDAVELQKTLDWDDSGADGRSKLVKHKSVVKIHTLVGQSTL